MASIGTFVAEFIGSFEGLTRPMHEAAGHIEAFQTKVGEAGQTMTGIGAAASAIGVPFLAAAKSALDTADSFNDMSKRIGVSVETLSGFAYVAKQSGTSIDALEGGLKRMVGSAFDASEGSKTAGKAFDALGISVKDSGGELKTADELMIDVADRFAEMEDGSTKTALAVDLFGKSGSDLIPMLNEGGDGIARMVTEADDLGLVLSTETAEGADALFDSIDKLAGAFGGIINQVVSSDLVKHIADFATKAAEVVAEFREANPMLVTAIGLIGGLAAVIGPALLVIGGLSLAIGAISTPVLAVFGAAGVLVAAAAALYQFGKDNEAVAATLTTIWEGIKSGLGTIMDGLRSVFDAAVITFQAIWDTWGGTIIDTWNMIWDTFAPIVTAAFDIITGILGGALTALGGIIQTVGGILTGDWSMMAKGLESIWSGIWSAIKSVILGAASVILRQVGTLVRGIGGLANALGMSGLAKKLNDASAGLTLTADNMIAFTEDTKAGKAAVVENKDAIVELVKEHGTFKPKVDANRDAQEKFNKEIIAARDSIIGVKEPTIAWKTALHDLEAEGRLGITQILGLKNEINALKDSKDPLIQKYRELIPLLETAKSRYEAQKEVTIGLAAATRDVTTIVLPDWMIGPDPIISAPLVAERWQEDLEADMNAAYNEMLGIQEKIRVDQKETADQAKQRMTEAVEDVKTSAGEIFDAMFVDGQNVFSSLGNMLKGGALSLGRSIFQDITGELLGPIKKAFDDFFTALLESTGIKAFISGLGSKLSGMLASVFGGGGEAAAGAAGSAGAGAAGSAASGAGSAGSSAAGGFGSSFSGSALGAGVGSLIGTYLGSMRLEGTMNAVEANTRFTYIELRDTMNQILWPIYGMVERSTTYIETLGIHLIPAIEYSAQYMSTQIRLAIFDVVSAVQGLVPAMQSITFSAQLPITPEVKLPVPVPTTPPVPSPPAIPPAVGPVPQLGDFAETLRQRTGPGFNPSMTEPQINMSDVTPLVMNIDGREIGRILIPNINDAVKYGGMQLVASEVR